jgi:hypothetical protein
MKAPEEINEELVVRKIYSLRGYKVMIDQDLAEMYGVATKRLNEQVKRNSDRFPEDFMFRLTEQEVQHLRSQIATSSWGGRRTLPYAFTEHGVLMLSSVLTSSIATQVNIKIMRVYTKLREMVISHKDILLKLEMLERQVVVHDNRMTRYDEEIQVIFDALKELLDPAQEPRKRIGFLVADSD